MLSLPFTPDLPAQLRSLTDPPADAVAELIVQQGLFREVNAALAAAPRNADPLPEQLPAFVRDFFTETASLPAGTDHRQLKKGHAFFARLATPLLSGLGYLSLPYCYAAADGAQVLWLSQRIRRDTHQRLLETGTFVLDVMHPQAFTPEGRGIRSAQKVRLLHAVIRQHIRNSGQWNEGWGPPANQEDMASTNLAFSFIALRGLDRMGFSYSKEEGEAYLHLWNAIGGLLGVREEARPQSLKAAYWLDKWIAERHFRVSEAGQGLTAALVGTLQNLVPNPALRPLVPATMRHLLGEEVANLLGLPASTLPTGAFLPLRAAQTLGNLFGGDSQATAHALGLALQYGAESAAIRLPEKMA